MKKIIIAVVALLVLGGGGGAAYFFFMKPAEAAVTDEEPTESEEAAHDEKSDKKEAKKDEHGDGHGEEGPKTQFVELDPLTLPILDNDGVNQTVSLVIALEVESASVAAEIMEMQPKLKDAFIEDMYGMLNHHAAMKGGVLQVSEIKQRLNKISTDVMGEDKIKDVLLQVVQQRPI